MKIKTAIIGGTLFYKSKLFSNTKPKEKSNCHGQTVLFISKNAIFLPRHGPNHNIPPHKINHNANMLALKDMGVEYIIGACSAGSLKKSIKPGTLVIPDDYINLYNQATIFNDSIVHITPELNEELRQIIIKTAAELEYKTINSGVYVQTTGPRLETKAEIKMLSKFADIVGMTMGQEASIAQELGIKYASLCSVDNYANGISSAEISSEDILEFAGRNSEKVKNIAIATVEKLA